MENKDKMLKDFFTENKKEITDNGFSQNVMRKLPAERKIEWIIPAFTLIGLFITILLLNVEKLILNAYLLISQLPLLYIAGFFFAIPFVALAAWYLNEKEYGIFG